MPDMEMYLYVMKEILIDFGSYVENIGDFWAHTSCKLQTGKKEEPIIEHMKLTMEYYEQLCFDKGMDTIAKGIIDRLVIDGKPLPDEYRLLIYRLFVNAIYLHDTGKINPSFQANVLNNKRVNCKKDLPEEHSIYSALIYIDIFTPEIKCIRDRLSRSYIFNVLYSFAYSISRHHGSLNDTEGFIDSLYKAQSNAKRGALAYYNSKTVNDIDFTKGGENPFKKGNRFYSLWGMEETEFYILNKLLFSLIITCDYYSTYEYIGDTGVSWGYIGEAEEWEKKYKDGRLYNIIQGKRDSAAGDIRSLDMNGLRTRIFFDAEKGLLNNSDSNIFYLEAPTGSGKTNTSINLMLKLLELDNSIKNVFYIFPFNTLVEQTAGTLREYFGKEAAVVNSITPIIIDERKTGDSSIADFDAGYLNRLFFHYPLSITSHVNLFNALFGISRENLYMLPRLCGSVIIMDEIQCYKNKIWREIIIMLQKYSELLNIKIIIMSATLPRLDYMLGENVQGFAALLENSGEYYENSAFKNRVLLDTSLLSEEKIPLVALVDAVIMEYKKRKGKCLIEFIKKGTAREFYILLKKRLREEDAELQDTTLFELTGDDNNFTRKAIIAQINNLEKVIVVSTQVIEAGVDIDMDYGFKNISLIDSEEQFLGRINRACKKQGCKVFFFMADEPEDIYKEDNRAGFTLKDSCMLSYLASKDFKGYYESIMNVLMKKSSKQNTHNIKNFKDKLLGLRYKEIHSHMKLIEDRNVQLFLAHTAQIDIDGKKEIIDGRAVWQQYKELCMDKTMGFAERQIKLSQLGEKMSCFTYNVSREQAEAYHDEHFGLYYVENGEDFIDDGKFMRKIFIENHKGLFI
ncbi:CRISPR-associated Cas3 family helicase [Ruminiclostridium sufflavum DSM 19573]|uniref:CRISPR-associated Cas3 family helicase n=1 Tax=Ruminiclostridium sufflavum DSM 19573 TaxID=1121337 RepID=A0A318XM00_9FIRM|nr:CRISPR-associated helicase Cas3' [Ruminiclostridium sufflavum]PYG86982.1 CRISPR-associated Cas3 family helicase [Ruminiclostridium sufflavum DSM 19573]